MNTKQKNLLLHVGALLISLLISALYFSPQLSGKVVNQSDTVQFQWSAQETRAFKKATGERTNWTNSMFSGMPNYQISAIGDGNNLQKAEKLIRFDIKEPISRFFIAMMGFYILAMVLKINYWVALIGAFAFAFTTNNLVLVEAGHITKTRVISYLPLATAGILLAFKKNYLWGGVLFAFGFGLAIYVNHPQMVYYYGLTLVILGVAQAIYSYKKGELMDYAKAVSVLGIAGLMALLAAAGNLWVTYEYSKDTIRGKPILSQRSAANSEVANKEGGLDWDYAMAWSNNTLDCLQGFIPGIVGGSSREHVKKGSAPYKGLQKGGLKRLPNEVDLPLYWGALPFTSGPIYFGAGIIFLFILGLLLVKGPVKWWLGLGVLLTLLLSMGKNLAFVSHFFYDHVPLYNKFRTPNSVLAIASFLIPLLATMALDHIIRRKTSIQFQNKSLYIAGGISLAIALFFYFIAPGMYDFVGGSDNNIKDPGFLKGLHAARVNLLRADALRSFAIVLLTAAAVWAFINKKIKTTVLLAVIAVVTIFDIWTIGQRYFNNDTFVNATQSRHFFNPSQADTDILKDKSLGYRVFDLSDKNPFNSAKASYFHKSIGGYHAAKLRRYEDLIQYHLNPNDPNVRVLNMLNTKYVIQNDADGHPQVQQNPGAIGPAWFIDTIRMVATPDEEILALNDFNPSREVVVLKEYSGYLKGFKPSKNGQIKMTSYQPNRLVYSSNSSSEQLAVFSEIWYGPDKGWQAYIDGQKAEHIRVNYLLRAMRIPAGQHEIVFEFKPKRYAMGVTVSKVASSLILLAMIALIIFSLKGYFTGFSRKDTKRK